jgi:hypothetical protein
MARFILLNQENRDHVLSPGLNPILRVATAATPDPVFILNTLVLADPAHEDHWVYLGALPQMDIADPDFPVALEPPEEA